MTIPNVVEPYSLTFENKGKYLFSRVEGNFDSAKISLQYWSRIVGVCRRMQFSRILVVEALARNMLLPEAFKATCAFTYEEFQGLKIAFVDLYHEHTDTNDFAIRFATSRGMNIKAFENVREAESWLLNDEELSYKAAAGRT